MMVENITREEYESRHKEVVEQMNRIETKLDEFRTNHFGHFKDDISNQISSINKGHTDRTNNLDSKINRINNRIAWAGGGIAVLVFLTGIVPTILPYFIK